MWNGMFSPYVRKHRDYQHTSFFYHMLDNGGSYRVAEPVHVKYRPLNAALHFPSARYYFVEIFFGHDEDEAEEPTPYIFLIHSEPDESPPNEDSIRDEFDEQCKDPIIGGRDWFDYLDFDSELTMRSGRVLARLEDEPPRMGPPRQRRARDEDNRGFVDSLLI